MSSSSTANLQAINHASVVLRVLFVCIGNSCRSPMAEAILKSLVDENYWEIDSAALADWNVGLPPEPRCIQVLGENGLTTNHIARQVEVTDFHHFDYVFGMDEYNIEELMDLAPKNSKAKIELLGSYDYGQHWKIVDPYFEPGIAGFERAYEQIHRSCKNFVDRQIQAQPERFKSELPETQWIKICAEWFKCQSTDPAKKTADNNAMKKLQQ